MLQYGITLVMNTDLNFVPASDAAEKLGIPIESLSRSILDFPYQTVAMSRSVC
jgi:hypothetical protein